MQKIRIDIVSDVMCPWCAVGFNSLNKALEAMAGKVQAEIHWQPFELNPGMPAEGQNMREHLMEKYGLTAEQSDQNRATIAERGAAVGFEFNFTNDMRMWNTFKAHQLLHWAGETNLPLQTELKKALFAAHFQQHKDINAEEVLLEAVAMAGLDVEVAKEVLADERYVTQVRGMQQQWQEAGVRSVPAFILQEKYLISGGQPPEAFVEAITQALTEQE